MISVDEAIQLVIGHTPSPRTITLPLQACAGHVLAQDILSPGPFPSFDQSAMDGYAFCFADWQQNPLPVDGETAAGQFPEPLIQGTTRRIFTGAAIPPGADTVVMQEHVQTHDGVIHIENSTLIAGANVRKQGSQIQAGECALPSGHTLQAAGIGFLASMGFDRATVFEKPVIHIVVTGSELLPPGAPAEAGKVYESNSVMLLAALRSIGMEAQAVHHVPDDPQATLALLDRLSTECDYILATGGVSVGDYDFVGQMKHHPAFQSIFHKVKQKPGKPLLFGQFHRSLVFGLPGNPASVLTCFYAYVMPSLLKASGISHSNHYNKARLSEDLQKKPGLTVFYKAVLQDDVVRILPQQESYILRSYALANCLVVVQEEDTLLHAGYEVSCLLIPLMPV
ncbi:MAG: molybdopterin molybdotransferase MoeA [Chitinophagales bacterium]|nr:molybdopterin molybdotransferase MoeA [Chitinophagales bacterium]HAE14606.1 molybdopterin molybdenumtransferase MoeA [Bacteroidota bacterium]MCB9019092.1 molybdopterin molybdotransferase MoeA [Chitinophagales bacterium]MCB9022495.1 molybdopterin molybdotransferase MoeA [Chitinophagales bacterium]HAE34486.1 molybdopterin molybdenumtransferase MoeA [Bacteroidota bacterium]